MFNTICKAYFDIKFREKYGQIVQVITSAYTCTPWAWEWLGLLHWGKSVYYSNICHIFQVGVLKIMGLLTIFIVTRQISSYVKIGNVVHVWFNKTAIHQNSKEQNVCSTTASCQINATFVHQQMATKLHVHVYLLGVKYFPMYIKIQQLFVQKWACIDQNVTFDDASNYVTYYKVSTIMWLLSCNYVTLVLKNSSKINLAWKFQN